VEKIVKLDTVQRATVELQEPVAGRVQVSFRPFPHLQYGDLVRFRAALELPDVRFRGYFLKEQIGAVAAFPSELSILSHDAGSPLKARLFQIRSYVEEQFFKALPPQAATLMTGLVLGKSGGFSKQFMEKLKTTGTTHLVALSGYNIAIIIKSLLYTFGFAVNRRYAVYLCILMIIAFVVMTGAEASVVRAAIMASIMIIAERSSRAYSVRNAIAVTALVMVLYNPAVLASDIGFQLSFLALMGIVYLQPAMERFFKAPEGAGWFGWRNNLFATCAAQLAVLPILLGNFGFFSPISLVTNVLLLSAVPVTMGLGFGMVLGSLISPFLTHLLAVPARLLLEYELAVIDLFAKISWGFQTDGLPIVLGVLYYAGLAGFVMYVSRVRQIAQ
jgi:competence protein ComEC